MFEGAAAEPAFEPVFYDPGMFHASADPDGIRRARIHGITSRWCAQQDPAGADREAAIAELRRCVTTRQGVRGDLLSTECGVFQGLAEGSENEWYAVQHGWRAGLCREAAGEDLDEQLVAEWTAVGRERARPKPRNPDW